MGADLITLLFTLSHVRSQTNYPERLQHLYIWPTNAMTHRLWALFQPFCTASTVARVVLVDHFRMHFDQAECAALLTNTGCNDYA